MFNLVSHQGNANQRKAQGTTTHPPKSLKLKTDTTNDEDSEQWVSHS